MNIEQVAILIPVFNGLDFTIKCLSGLVNDLKLLGEDGNRFKIVIIDDGSTDGTKDWISENLPEVILLFGDGNLWWSGGINAGSRYALDELGCNYVLWWNNDIQPENDYLKRILSIVDEDKPNVITGSKIYFADNPSLIWSMGGLFNRRTGSKILIGYRKEDSDEFRKIIAVDWLPGMGTLIHRNVFNKIGYVNEKEFPQYHGDSDFIFRARLAGFEIIVDPELRIWNDKSKSGIQHDNNMNRFFHSLTSIRSNNHIGKDFLFYRKYTTSPFAYFPLIKKYFFYIGGFIRWKTLSWIGIKRNKTTN